MTMVDPYLADVYPEPPMVAYKRPLDLKDFSQMLHVFSFSCLVFMCEFMCLLILVIVSQLAQLYTFSFP